MSYTEPEDWVPLTGAEIIEIISGMSEEGVAWGASTGLECTEDTTNSYNSDGMVIFAGEFLSAGECPGFSTRDMIPVGNMKALRVVAAMQGNSDGGSDTVWYGALWYSADGSLSSASSTELAIATIMSDWFELNSVFEVPAGAAFVRPFAMMEDQADAAVWVGLLDVETVTPIFRAYRSAAQTGVTTAGDRKIRFDAESYDYGSNFTVDADDSGGATESRFVAPFTGIYDFAGAALFGTYLTAGYRAYLILKKNGSALAYGQMFNSNESWYPQLMVVSGPVLLAAGDYVELFVYHNLGSDIQLSLGQTWFSGSGKAI